MTSYLELKIKAANHNNGTKTPSGKKAVLSNGGETLKSYLCYSIFKYKNPELSLGIFY